MTSRGNCQRNVTCDVSLLVIRVIVSQSHESATARLSHPGRHGGSAPWLPGRAADPLRRARSAEGRPDSVGVQVSGIMSSVRQSTQLNLAVTLAVSDPGPGEFKCRVTSHGHRRRRGGLPRHSTWRPGRQGHAAGVWRPRTPSPAWLTGRRIRLAAGSALEV